jgi:hypothetical protein
MLMPDKVDGKSDGKNLRWRGKHLTNQQAQNAR